MEKNGFIKAVKTQDPKRKKVFLLADVEPSVNLTGGVGQADPEILELRQLMMDRAYDYVCTQAEVTTRDLVTFMRSVGSASEKIKQFTEDDFQR